VTELSKAEIVQIRPAGPDHQVVTVQSAKRLYRREPCPTCPWRTDAVGEFPAEAFRHSANTACDASMHVFSCHSSGAERPAMCAGFLVRNSENNLAVRLRQACGDLDMDEVHDGGHELFNSYREMAIANGVPADDPELAQCRADFDGPKR
jgi:Family of unknown function (DUF6283)